MQYLSNTHDRYFFSYEKYLDLHKAARDNWALDTWNIMLAAESCLEKNQTKIITQTPEQSGVGITFTPFMTGNTFIPELAFFSFFAINEAETRAVAKVSYDGDMYSMELKYYIFDYYDWEERQTTPLPLVSCNELYKLCRSGYARFYENWGVYTTTLSWKATTEDRNAV